MDKSTALTEVTLTYNHSVKIIDKIGLHDTTIEQDFTTKTKTFHFTDSPVMESNFTHLPNDVMNVTDHSTAVFGTKMDTSESTFDATLIVAIVCFGVGALVITLAFVRLGVYIHQSRRKKEHKKWWARQLEHKRHLDDYCIKTEIASQHSMISASSTEPEEHKDENDENEAKERLHDNGEVQNEHETTDGKIGDEKTEEKVDLSKLRRKKRRSRDSKDSNEVQIPTNEIEAIIGTAESRKTVRRSFYGLEHPALSNNGRNTLDLGMASPKNRRSFYMNTKSGTLSYT